MENNIILESLMFLINDYACTYKFEKNIGNFYTYANKNFKLIIYEFKQFDDLNINLIFNETNYNINPEIECPREFANIMKKKRGIKGWFYTNYEKDYWFLISQIIQKKLNNQ